MESVKWLYQVNDTEIFCPYILYWFVYTWCIGQSGWSLTRGTGRMKLTDHFPHPKNCFCNIPIELLRKWYVKRYVDDIPTLELMEIAESDSDKEAICAIATFDIDEEDMLEMMGDINMPEHHIIHCRAKVKEELELELID